MFVCPHCGKSDSFEIITRMPIHLWQKKDGKFSVDLDFMSDLCPDLPFAFTGKANKSTVEVVMNEDYKRKERFTDNTDNAVLCLSEECDGKEYKISELLLSQEERVAEKGW